MKNFVNKEDPKKSSEETIELLLSFIEGLIDSRIEQRIASNDLIKVYDAKIVGILEGGSAATLLCDDVAYYAKNCTGIAFNSNDIGKWAKMITYDNVQYFVLHKLEPNVIDTEGLKEEILKEVKDYVSSLIGG